MVSLGLLNLDVAFDVNGSTDRSVGCPVNRFSQLQLDCGLYLMSFKKGHLEVSKTPIHCHLFVLLFCSPALVIVVLCSPKMISRESEGTCTNVYF